MSVEREKKLAAEAGGIDGVAGWSSQPFDAPERTRTSTDHSVHKALNLARLPIPPQAQRARV